MGQPSGKWTKEEEERERNAVNEDRSIMEERVEKRGAKTSQESAKCRKVDCICACIALLLGKFNARHAVDELTHFNHFISIVRHFSLDFRISSSVLSYFEECPHPWDRDRLLTSRM